MSFSFASALVCYTSSMATPFDSATKHLVEAYPQDWLALAGIRCGRIDVVDADVSSVTASADKVLRVTDPAPCVGHSGG